MGCAASSDTGTQFAQVGQHSHKPVHTQQQQHHRQQLQQEGQQQQQQPTTQQNSQQQQQTATQPNDQPPPYQKSTPAPIVAEKPQQKVNAAPVAKQNKDAQSGVDFYNTDNVTVPGLPDFSQHQYVSSDIGTYDMFLDFRTSAQDFPTHYPPENNGELFTDYDFTVEVAHPQRSDLEWKRPGEICEAPVLFAEGTTRFDIGQGELGTCWFLAMVANIADKPRLLRRVIPADGYKAGTDEYDGVFHCRFWRFGVWVDVYIDDYLPIVHGDCIMGAKSSTDSNEMWVSLLEKAFAKLYGSYVAIEAGLTADSYMNLTGGIAEYLHFKKRKVRPQRLFSRLRNAFKCPTTMVGCAVPSANDGVQGLVGGHAYSMSGAFRVGDAMLVRVRNPWGSGEWKGAWSDGSPEWDSAPSNCVPSPNKDDGEFYMEIHDFMEYFEDCTICNLTPDFDREDDGDTLNYVTSMYGNWREDKMGGSENKGENPMFSFTLGEDCLDSDGHVPVVVQLVQRTNDRQEDVEDIRCDLFRVNAENDKCISLEDVGDKSMLYMGNMQETYRFLVTPGTYVAIPSTLEAGTEKEFMVRIFTAGPVSNPHEVRNKITMIGQGRNGEEPFDMERFSNTQCAIGAFQSGYNAGGQVACDGFSTNPQYLLTVPEDQTIRIEMSQPEISNGFAIGLKLFQAPPDFYPVDQNWLMENYDYSVRDSEGGDGPFQFGPSTAADFGVTGGTYILLVHCNEESDENDFSVAVYSQTPIDMQSANV